MLLPAFTLSVELVGSQYRTLAGMLVQIPFAIGEAFAGILAIFVADWREYHYVTSVPLFLLLGLAFVIPESPRWLMAAGRSKELSAMIQKMADTNGKKISSDILERINQLEVKFQQCCITVTLLLC